MNHSNPCFIKHFSEIPAEEDVAPYPGNNELFSIVSSFSKHIGLSKLGIHHELLPPGRRTSLPHAESDEDEFVFVIEGAPDVWIDGTLYRLEPGVGVGFPAGTGIAHSFLNNTADPVRLLVVGEANKPSNKVVYPLNPELRSHKRDQWWDDAPTRRLGSHDGKPTRPMTGGTLGARPSAHLPAAGSG